MAFSPGTSTFFNLLFIILISITLLSLIIYFFIYIRNIGVLGGMVIKNSFLIGSIFLGIIVILFFIIVPITFKNNIVDNFSNMIPNIQIQTGRSGISQTGTITFPVSFMNKPKVFTQIIGDSNTLSNVYSVQIFDITPSGFNYSKNKVIDNTSGNFTISSLETATVEPFDWIAIG